MFLSPSEKFLKPAPSAKPLLAKIRRGTNFDESRARKNASQVGLWSVWSVMDPSGGQPLRLIHPHPA
jgi:hypothetical protein